MSNLAIKLQNHYSTILPDKFYQVLNPHQFRKVGLVRINHSLAKDLNLDLNNSSDVEIAKILSGQKILKNSKPIALAYAGHQFGHFVNQLGDGRAVLLGEILAKDGKLYDIHLKGSGKTKFSRSGDGFATLGSVIREYIISEAMHALKIPTTRSLAIIATNENVIREFAFPGAVLTRVATSHIRVGTFEYFASRGDKEALKQLCDYAIDRHYPNAKKDKNPYLKLFKEVIKSQAQLIASWMSVGFVHGVMNTDNMTISGETIDYGPCAFLDEYDANKVFSSIDRFGRYAFSNQPKIAKWNLFSLGSAIAFLFDKNEEKAMQLCQKALESFANQFNKFWIKKTHAKLGIFNSKDEYLELIQDLFNLMQKHAADFTITFKLLGDVVDKKSDLTKINKVFSDDPDFKRWLKNWREILKSQGDIEKSQKLMKKTNPVIIPRNHKVEEAIEAAVDEGDFSKMNQLIDIVSKPYVESEENLEYQKPPTEKEKVRETFCGT